MKKFFVSLLLSLVCFEAQAIRFVGNGGGDAELKIITYLEALPVWLEFCSNEGNKCVENVEASFWKSFIVEYTRIKITEIDIINDNDFTGQVLQPSVDGQKLVLTFESLYIDNKIAKTDNVLFSILLRKIFQAVNLQASFTVDSMLILPEYKKHPHFEIYAFSLKSINKLHSPNNELNTRLNNHSELKNIKIISETSSGYMIENIDSGAKYELYISEVRSSKFQVVLYLRF